MIEWTDDAIVLSARPQGESGALVSVFSRNHGRQKGIVHGGQSRSKQAFLQAGQQVKAVWRARLSDQLGTYTLEPVWAWSAPLMDDARALAGLSAACAMLDGTLAEGEAHPALYEGFLALLGSFSSSGVWPFVYVRWELGLLAELGYGVDLSQCAVTGTRETLTHVSPNSGRAVCALVAAPYKERLLPVPRFLVGGDAAGSEEDVCAGLRLSGFFFARHVFAGLGRIIPPARMRLVDIFSRPREGF